MTRVTGDRSLAPTPAPNRLASSRYVRVFFRTLVGGVLLVILTNALVDPYGLTHLVAIPTVNADKPFAQRFGLRRKRSLDLAFRRFDAVILGTSRAVVLSSEHPAFDGQRVYNAALGGTSMVEIARVFEYAADRQALKTVVVGLDFLGFSDARTVSADFDQSSFAGDPPWWGLTKTLVNGQTLRLSLETLVANRWPDDSLKFTRIAMLQELVARYGDDARARFTGTIRAFLSEPDLYGCYRYDPKRAEAVGGLVRRALGEGALVRIFLSPVHAHQLEAIRAAGLLAVFERWKLDVTRAVAREARQLARSERNRVALWDFSGYGSITTEPVPPPGQRMRWYYESSHYREELGDLVLARMLGSEGNLPQAELGTRLNLLNVSFHLRATRRAREAWAAEHPDAVATIDRMVDEADRVQMRRCRTMRKRKRS
jgi:hypothetical protein